MNDTSGIVTPVYNMLQVIMADLVPGVKSDTDSKWQKAANITDTSPFDLLADVLKKEDHDALCRSGLANFIECHQRKLIESPRVALRVNHGPWKELVTNAVD